MKRITTFLLLLLLLTQCAARYRPIKPEEVVYEQVFENDDILFKYRYEALKYRNNRKLAKTERKSNMRIVAAEITNKTTRTLNIERDMDIFTDEEDPYYIEGGAAATRLRQSVNTYLFYGLLLYGKFDCPERGLNCKPRYIVPFGFGIAAYNMIVAKKANKAMTGEFQKYSIYDRDIAPGQTVYAILVLEFEQPDELPLHLEIRENSRM